MLHSDAEAAPARKCLPWIVVFRGSIFREGPYSFPKHSKYLMNRNTPVSGSLACSSELTSHYPLICLGRLTTVRQTIW